MSKQAEQKQAAAAPAFSYVGAVQAWDSLCTELASKYGEDKIRSLRSDLIELGNPTASVPSTASDPADMILTTERNIGMLDATLKSIRQLSEHSADGKSVKLSAPITDAPLPADSLARLSSVPHSIAAAAFRDYERVREDVIHEVKDAMNDRVQLSLVPAAIALSVRESVPLGPLQEGAMAFKYWCSPRLLHMAKWVDARRKFDNSNRSELLDFFAESIAYEARQSSDDSKMLMREAAAFAVKRVWDRLAGSSLVSTNPARLLDNLKTLKSNLEKGTFRESFGFRIMQAVESGQGLPSSDSKPADTHFATAALLEEFNDPMKSLIKMQRSVLASSANPATQVKCMDGKMRALAEYDQYVGKPVSSPVSEAPTKPPALKEVKSWRAVLAKEFGDREPEIKTPIVGPMAAAAAGKAHQSSPGHKQKRAELAMPLVQRRDAVCPQYLDPEVLYRQCSMFFFPDVKSYRGSETAATQSYWIARRFSAIEADARLNRVDQQPTDKIPYKGQRWANAKICKAIWLLTTLEYQMSIDFEQYAVTEADSQRKPEHAITTSKGRTFKRVHQLNMSRWLYGYSEESEPRNCWIEMDLKSRTAILKHVRGLLRGLHWAASLSSSAAQESKDTGELVFTKADIDSDQKMRGVNELLAFLPTRLDNTDPLGQSVMGADEPKLAYLDGIDSKLRGLRTALLGVLSTRATTDAFRSNAFSPETRTAVDASAFDWIVRKQGRLSDAVQSMWPFLSLRAPPIASKTFSGHMSEVAELNKATNLMRAVPFKITVDALRKGLAFQHAMYCATAFCFSKMARTLCQFEVDKFLGDVLSVEHARQSDVDEDVPHVPWTSSYRSNNTASKSKLFAHPTGVSTIYGLIHELSTEKKDRFARIHKRISGLVAKSSAQQQDRVNMSAVYSILHEEQRSAERIPGMINDFYALAETLFALARQHTAALYASRAPTEDDVFASAYLVQCVNDLVLIVSRKCDALLRELGNDLRDVTSLALEEWESARRKGLNYDRFRTSTMSRVHEFSWKCIGAGARNSENVYSVMGQVVNLSRAKNIEKLLYMATAPWMLNALVYDKGAASAPLRSVSEYLLALVNRHVKECFESE